MPFTPTHVLAVVPLWPLRRTLPFTALVIGSMLPDLALLYPLLDYGLTHSAAGLMTACLPVGISLYVFFELVMRGPLTCLMPVWIQRRSPAEPTLRVQGTGAEHCCRLLGAAMAIVVGAWTHQIWDAFTHRGRWGTQVWPALNLELHILGLPLRGYKMFQYGSTLIGLPLLVLLAVQKLRVTRPHEIPETTLGKWKPVVFTLILGIPLVYGLLSASQYPHVYQAIGMAVRRSGALLLVGLALYSLLFHALVTINAKTSCGK